MIKWPAYLQQFSIQDRMTSRLNTMIGAAQRLNRTLDATDADETIHRRALRTKRR